MKEMLLALEKEAMERWRKGDPFGFVEISADDVIYIDPGQTRPVLGLEKYKALMSQALGKIQYQGSEFINPTVVISGDAAVLTYNYRSSVITPEGVTTSQLPWNATEVYFKQDNQWRIVHSHWSFTRHKLPPGIEIPIAVQMAPKQYDGVLGELMALESAAMERWRKGDPWGFTDLYTPEVTYFDTGTPQRIDGREAMIVEYKLREGKIFYDVMDFIEPEVRVSGDMAVLVYRFLSTWLNPDGSVLNRTPWNCTEVYLRMSGRWRIIHNHWSFIQGEMA